MRELEAMFEVFENTMSVHLRENQPMLAKHGTPGEWDLDSIDDDLINREYLVDLSERIIEYVGHEDNAFIEDDQELVQVVQLVDFRIVITTPPFSDAFEITIVRPTMQKSIESYSLAQILLDRLEDRAEGILIAGAPGHGCGHNLLGVAGIAACLALKELIANGEFQGTIRYYGCPAEENADAKGGMVKVGAFSDVDISLTWHPWDLNMVLATNFQAIYSVVFNFKGKTPVVYEDSQGGFGSTTSKNKVYFH